MIVKVVSELWVVLNDLVPPAFDVVQEGALLLTLEGVAVGVLEEVGAVLGGAEGALESALVSKLQTSQALERNKLLHMLYLDGDGYLDGVGVPDVDCALAFVGVFGRVVDSDPLNLAVQAKELWRSKHALICETLRNPNHIEQVLLDDAVLEQLLDQVSVFLF